MHKMCRPTRPGPPFRFESVIDYPTEREIAMFSDDYLRESSPGGRSLSPVAVAFPAGAATRLVRVAAMQRSEGAGVCVRTTAEILTV